MFKIFLKPPETQAGAAILRSGVSYIDDAGRACDGYRGWDNFSRYLSNFLSVFIHTDRYLSDISPLPQLIAVMMVSLSGIIVIYLITGRTSISVWLLAAVLPLGLSPYFLACLSYKFDAPYMALSVLASVAPFLLWKEKGRRLVYAAAAASGILAVCTTYQAALGIFPLIAVFISIKRWNDGDEWRKIVKFLLVSMLAYAAGLAVFRAFIMKQKHRQRHWAGFFWCLPSLTEMRFLSRNNTQISGWRLSLGN